MIKLYNSLAHDFYSRSLGVFNLHPRRIQHGMATTTSHDFNKQAYIICLTIMVREPGFSVCLCVIVFDDEEESDRREVGSWIHVYALFRFPEKSQILFKCLRIPFVVSLISFFLFQDFFSVFFSESPTPSLRIRFWFI